MVVDVDMYMIGWHPLTYRTGPSGSRCLRIERWPAASATTGCRGDSVGVAPDAADVIVP